MSDDYRHCSQCKGRAPFPEFCTNKTCKCHTVTLTEKGNEKPIDLGYNDPTVRKVLKKLGAKR